MISKGFLGGLDGLTDCKPGAATGPGKAATGGHSKMTKISSYVQTVVICRSHLPGTPIVASGRPLATASAQQDEEMIA
jgi:hypothetical protein